jgi:hypothetical protein
MWWKVVRNLRLALLRLVLLGSPAFLLCPVANAAPGACENGAVSSSDCQFEVVSKSIAPSPSISRGLRLDAGVSNVLFNNYPGIIPPYYISNNGLSDIFVPQNSSSEFQSFINAVLSAQLTATTAANAVTPNTYLAKPDVFNACTFTPISQSVNVPSNTVNEAPLTRNGYTYLDAAYISTPASLTTQVGPVSFTQTRTDCSKDNENNAGCNTAIYTNAKTFTFSATGATPNYTWNIVNPVVRNTTLSLSVNGGSSATVADCSSTQAPVLHGICGPNNGADLTSIPTTGLCNSGDASNVSSYSISGYGEKWGWTCNDVQGTITGILNNSLTSGVGCAACQDKAKQVVSNCSATCGGGTQTVTWYDGCGNVETQYSQSCNTQTCCTNNAYSTTGGCSASCGGGEQTVTWYDSCGNVESQSSQSCNTQACYLTYVYASYTDGGGACSNIYGCSDIIYCQVGTNCSQEMHSTNSTENNCNDNYYWYITTYAGSSSYDIQMYNRCGSGGERGAGLCPNYGSGDLCGYTGMLYLY